MSAVKDAAKLGRREIRASATLTSGPCPDPPQATASWKQQENDMGCNTRHVAMIGLLALVACSGATVRDVPLAGDNIAPGISVLRGVFVPGAQPDGNTVLLRAPDGLIVVDSGRHAAHTQRILSAADSAGQPIAAIVNTHWHLDHVAGNAMLRGAYPRSEVYASDAIHGALGGFLADYRKQLLQAISQAPQDSLQVATWQAEVKRIDSGEQLLPTRPVTTAGDTVVADRLLRLGLERNAVSGGDVWVFDPASRVLVAGDLVTLPVPLFDTACPQGWSEALERLQAQPFDLLVPGHGAPLSRLQFDRYRAAFDNLLSCAAGDAGKPACIDAWLRDAQALFPASEIPLARSSLDYYVDVLRAPDARLAKRYCRAGGTA
jgi:glyoxylase-like metal-dependent hydrolase (beta-lactamase superfamily II)